MIEIILSAYLLCGVFTAILISFAYRVAEFAPHPVIQNVFLVVFLLFWPLVLPLTLIDLITVWVLGGRDD